MSSSTETTEQSHLTLGFPAKSPADLAAMQAELPKMVPGLYKAGDAMGSMHYGRFTAYRNTVYLLADVDGDAETALAALPRYFGAVLDPLLAHVADAPPTPVASNTRAFADWAMRHNIKPALGYANYGGVPVGRVKSLAAQAGLELDVATAQQLPMLLMMPMTSREGRAELDAGLNAAREDLYKGADGIGTAHFAHFVEMPDTMLGFFTIYDGPFEKYAQDFAEHMGPAFDLLFAYTKNPPPTPTAKNVAPFTLWVREHFLEQLAFYSAYPGLLGSDIRALLAEA